MPRSVSLSPAWRPIARSAVSRFPLADSASSPAGEFEFDDFDFGARADPHRLPYQAVHIPVRAFGTSGPARIPRQREVAFPP